MRSLSRRHELTLFTKGHPDEQTLEIDRSGLRHFFAYTTVVHEKDLDAYARLVQDRSLTPGRTWMIGNSPEIGLPCTRSRDYCFS